MFHFGVTHEPDGLSIGKSAVWDCFALSYMLRAAAEGAALGWSDPAPNRCSCSYLTSSCQWDLPLLAHKKSLIKYYCGVVVCVIAGHHAARHHETSLVRGAALPLAGC